jgi:diguanylate cyclase (GGDEF)-like protein
METAIVLYYREPSAASIRGLQMALEETLTLVESRVPGFAVEAGSLQDDAERATSAVWIVQLVLILIAVGTLLLLVRHMSKTVRRAIEESAFEQAEFATSVRLQYRNDQLAALYNVFTEITDTLSLKYVVNATLRESMKIMHADMAVLRILRGAELIMAGAMTSGGQELQGLGPVTLGEGVTGRTALRGRSLRIDREGEQMMAGTATAPGMSPSVQSNRPEMQSGLIVPLVVGARVVGTLACWAIAEEAFNDEDQRVLEMMASQVATAIVAADTTDTSVRRAHHDALTGLPNRRQLDEDTEGSLKELAASGRNAVVAMLDIDHFKRFNDDYGHRVGDVTLQKVASVLRSSVRDNDHVYRYGGEEFVVVFADTPPSDAMMLADRLRQAIEAAPLSGENLEPAGPVTVSLGLAFLPEHGTDVSALIDMADKAMYRAKSSGRNCVEVWREEEDATALSTVA